MLSFCYQSGFGRGGKPCSYWVSGLQAVTPTRFWQAHLKHFCWAHLAHIIHIRHIPSFGMGYLTLCCQSVATLGRIIIANLEGIIKQIRLALFCKHSNIFTGSVPKSLDPVSGCPPQGTTPLSKSQRFADHPLQRAGKACRDADCEPL